jgi:hypothetical protein
LIRCCSQCQRPTVQRQLNLLVLRHTSELKSNLPVLVKENKIEAIGISSNRVATVPKLNLSVSEEIQAGVLSQNIRGVWSNILFQEGLPL